MPTIKTIMPAGGGDYLSLQAWWNWAKTQPTADQWAECYSGGNLGGLSMTGATFTPNVTEYVRIYAANGHGHGGQFDQGAFIEVVTGDCISSLPHQTRIDGLRMKATASTVVNAIATATDYFISVTNCILEATEIYTACLAVALDEFIQPAPDAVIFTANNLLKAVNTSETDYLWGMYVYYYPTFEDPQPATPKWICLNNTVYVVTSKDEFTDYYGSGIHLQTFNEYADWSASLIANNIVVGDARSSIIVETALSFPANRVINNLIFDNVISGLYPHDPSNLTNQSAAAVLADYLNDDYSLAVGSPAINAGTDLTAEGLVTDILGQSRPQGVSYDIGAFEYPQDPPPPTGGPRWPVALARRNRFASPGRLAP